MNKNFRKWLACSVAITIAVYNAPYSVEALEVIGENVQLEESTEQDQTDTENMTQAGDFFKVSGTENTDWTFSDNILTIKAGVNKDITIEGIQETTTDRIVVEVGFSGTITIRNVKINLSGKDYYCAFKIKNGDTNVTLNLDGDNTLKSGGFCAGLEHTNKKGKLIINGKGTLNANGGHYSAGIGGGQKGAGSNITILGGAIKATGGPSGAGIGGGQNGSGSNITISGGEVTATGGDHYPAGIGGGENGDGSNITISGGKVTAKGGENGAGIGGGQHGSGSNITISGGKVTATGNNNGAGIGGGKKGKYNNSGNGKNITISGGEVIATGSGGGAGIGGTGEGGVGSNITISGGTIKATGACGIGGGNSKAGSNIIISGGSFLGTISGTPKNESGEEVCLFKLENQGNFTGGSIKVVGTTANKNEINTDYNIGPNHKGDTSFYIYLPVGDYTITTHIDSYNVKVTKKPETPNSNDLVLTNTDKGLLVDVSKYKTEYGKVKCSIDGNNWKEEESIDDKRQVLFDVDPNNTSEQQIQIKYSGKDYYSESDISNKKFYLGRIVINESISYTGSEITESDILSSCSNGTVTLEYYQENSENEWVLLDNPPTNVGSYKVKATLEPSSNNYTKAIMEKEFEITKANSEVKITTSSLDKEYDGEVVNNPDYTTSIKDGKVTITWQKNIGTENEPNWVDLKEGAPKEAGSYQVVVELEGNSNYNSSSAILGFNISKANNDWSQALSIDGWTYGQDAKSPTATAKFGDVVFTYSNGENGTYVTEVPKNAGTYWVKATVEGTENYTGLESKVSFEIAQATGSIDFKDGAKLDKIYDGNAVAITDNHIEKSDSTGAVTFTFEKKVANGWKKTEAPSEVGTYRVKASLAEDNNYTSATSQYLEFTIYAKAPEVTEDNENIASSTDRIEVNTETEKDKKIYLYCTDSKDVPPPPEISTASLESVEVKAGEWQEVTGEKMIFTGLKSNTTYYVWKYDNTDPSKPKEEKLENIYAIKTDTPSTPSIPSIPDEKPGIGVDIDIVDKIAGETRYDTSVSISQKVFPSKSEKVYLVSGEKFPDALSSAALAGKGDGPILLINDKNIDKILSEIDRLDAKEIVFVGGSSISVANKEKVEKFAKENSSVVSAFVGEDRYETAVKVAEQTISKYGNKGKVIIADGRNYPDSVSIAPYAAKEGIPVILVNGNKVPDDVKSFLNKYKISNAIIVGGDKAVGKDVEKLFKSVDRVAGDDRYDTSKKIAEKFFDDSDTIFMASGEDFADSISVSYYAGMEKAPVLLTKSNSLDDSTREYLNSNKNKDYIIVGGDKAINPDLFK